jgi:iron complex outermembrane receptor protein
VSYFGTSVVGPATLELQGNQNLKLLTIDMLEFGYRGRIKENFEIDFVVFGSRAKNYTNIISESTTYDSIVGITHFVMKMNNLAVSARQFGATLSFNCVIGKFQVRPYASVQHTTLFDYSPYAVSPGADSSILAPNAATQNIYSGIGTKMKHRATPTLYGGVYLNYQVTSHLNLNMNAYFMTGHTQLESSNLTYNDGKRGVENINPRLIVNVVASYTFFKKLTLFLNFKNCLADRSREFYRGDVPGFKVSGGVNFEF